MESSELPAASPQRPALRLQGTLLATAVQRLLAFLRANRIELAIVASTTVAGAVLRIVLLPEIPPGLHGDEGVVGMDARRVVNEGWIGPYLPGALGYPGGPVYFAAPVVWILGDSIFSIRLAMGLLGIISIPAAYLAFRVMFDRTIAVFGALLLALSLWHLHFSRLGFPVISWPLMELVTLFFFFLALKTGRWLHFALAGLALGAGVYTYNGFPVFALPLGLAALWAALLRFRGRALLRYGGQIVLMVLVAAFAAIPMIQYAIEPGNGYLGRNRGVTVFDTEDWKARDFGEKVDFVFDRTRDFYLSAFWRGNPDGADGAGDEAMVDRLSLPLMALGALILLWRWRQPAAVLALLIVVLIPFGSILTINGLFRRSLGAVPFYALLAAAPLGLLWDQARALTLPWRNVTYAALGLVVAVIGYLNLSFYFGEFQDTPIAQFTFGPELTDASLLLNELPENTYVYFYSVRWSIGYETRQYIAPDVAGEDRSREFGQFSLAPDRAGPVLYLFLPGYLEQADVVQQRYPGGTLIESLNEERIVGFRAYYLPDAGPYAFAEPTEGEPGGSPPPTVAPTPAEPPGRAGDRDEVRQRDLAAVAQALEQYRAEHGSYPSTGGGIQSLCVFPELDVGCELREFLDPIPTDPLGDPVDQTGYWYASDGRRFTVYAQGESDRFPACPEHPAHLAEFETLLCVTGP